jgi:hypothetical protein
LNDSQRTIVYLYEKGVDIARDYSVSKETIYKIRRGKSYTDVN